MTFYAGCQASLADDKTDDFEIFLVEQVFDDGLIKLLGVPFLFHPDQLIYVHSLN